MKIGAFLYAIMEKRGCYMLVDITLKITKEIQERAPKGQLLAGHLGTHFDCMNHSFPLEYARSKGYIFDVSKIKDREIEAMDIDLTKVEKDMFIGFYTGCLDQFGYGTEAYHDNAAVLSLALIDTLIKKEIRIIGLDFMGARKSKEHTPTDQYCADHGVFIVENLCNMRVVVEQELIANVYPLSFEGTSGLPCRVIVEAIENH